MQKGNLKEELRLQFWQILQNLIYKFLKECVFFSKKWRKCKYFRQLRYLSEFLFALNTYTLEFSEIIWTFQMTVSCFEQYIFPRSPLQNKKF